MNYAKEADDCVRTEIEEILRTRPTYGYKRVTAMLNHKRETEGKKPYNRKRIYRVMKINGLILKKAVSERTHIPTGKVMTLHSNTRWCSDCFEIKCFNREKVYVAFSLDTHDREVIAFIASRNPILARDIQSLMLLSVEKRFGAPRTPRLLEWLSDRGSIYRANDTKAFGSSIGLVPRYTMAYSPESNGMAEALVKTIKRDYVYVNDCASPDVVLEMLPKWIKDYNEVAPHSALGMLSPVQYLRKVS
jgi:putative transposase